MLKTHIKHFPAEAIIWLLGLLFLAVTEPGASPVTICPLRLTGFEFCPGCGLGTAVSYLFRGEVMQSIEAHPLGIFAVIVLSLRIIRLSKQYVQSHGKNYRCASRSNG